MECQQKLADANGTIANQRWMIAQAGHIKPLSIAVPPNPLNTQLEARANEAEQALLSVDAKSVEIEEELKASI